MKPRILIVDDEMGWLSSHKEVIETSFPDYFELGFAKSAKEALKVIEEFHPQLLITDLVMEKTKNSVYAGQILAKQVKSQYPDTKIIIISGSSDVEQVASLTKADFCIPKWSLLTYPVSLKLKLKEFFQIKNEIC